MDISPLQRQVRAADLPLDKLASSKQVPEKEKVAEASRQFEAVLLRQVLADARRPHFKAKTPDTAAINGIYDDMVTNQLADAISKSGSIGLAKSLASQIDSRHHRHTASAADAARQEPAKAPAPPRFMSATPSKGNYYGRGKH